MWETSQRRFVLSARICVTPRMAFRRGEKAKTGPDVREIARAARVVARWDIPLRSVRSSIFSRRPRGTTGETRHADSRLHHRARFHRAVASAPHHVRGRRRHAVDCGVGERRAQVAAAACAPVETLQHVPNNVCVRQARRRRARPRHASRQGAPLAPPAPKSNLASRVASSEKGTAARPRLSLATHLRQSPIPASLHSPPESRDGSKDVFRRQGEPVVAESAPLSGHPLAPQTPLSLRPLRL